MTVIKTQRLDVKNAGTSSSVGAGVAPSSIAARMRQHGHSPDHLLDVHFPKDADDASAGMEHLTELETATPVTAAAQIRTYRPQDAAAIRTLYEDGLLNGHIADNDTALDIDDIEHAYLDSPFNHFWVAENDAGEIVGMIGVQHHDQGVGEIRRLRVRPDIRRQGVGSRLLEQAIRFCQEANCLKIKLDTHIERDPAIRLFEKFHFRHGRTRDAVGKQLLVFYLDLYSDET